ncbi:MAG: hypothetical protein ACYS9X_20130 [Planctomycetota bacterium]|jgi:hypothetical protein
MAEFPRTDVGGTSVPRLIAGTNWFLGFSHKTKAKDALINKNLDVKRIADILEVYLKAGVDAVYGMGPTGKMIDAIREAEDRVGRKMVRIAIPTLKVAGTAEARDENARILDAHAEAGVDILMPHQQATDALIDRKTRTIPGWDEMAKMVRERGMTPGLSTHMPETIVYADESGADVETYIQIYNASGFLMQVEIEWVNHVINTAKKPVICIKPLAAGRLTPFVGLSFVWNTIRDRDMVCVGTMAPEEAEECIELSLSILERRRPDVELQRTRSKSSIEPRKY